MCSAVNIRRDVSDKFYRYKMPRLISKVEGKGNGIKTVIPNMSDVAKALIFGCELGAQVIHDVANDRHIVNGAHDAEKLQTLLDTFIDKFVLCPSCKNPETDLVITKDEFIMRDCKACGAHLPVDMRHKLVTYIIKNPPVSAKKSKKEKKSKKAERSNTSTTNASASTEPASNGSGEDDGMDELTRQIEHDSALIPVASADNANDDDWVENTSAEAVASRMKELNVSGALSKLLDGEDEGDEGDDPVDQLAAYIRATPDATDKDIIAKASAFGLRDYKVCLTLASTFLNANVLSDNMIAKHVDLFSQFMKNEKCQKALLGGIERLAGVEYPELLPKVALILKALYDADLIEEEVILAWGDKPSKKYVDRKISKDIRVRAEPFLTWLREAEEDDDEDEDDEE
ncbi:hypothetical protein BSLG_008833 [Batrachochytrium salamandrivorans]|nr:hypothetical protein BSLG_008833 [Batrachochytrium salamandrivorans]